MLALQKRRNERGLELVEIAEPPSPRPGELLVEIAATGICGSDLSIEAWSASYSAFMAPALPVTLGHEAAGRVIASGDDMHSDRIGEHIVINPAVACGTCRNCKAGDDVGCLDRKAIGMVKNGAFARLCIVPANYAYSLPSSVPIELGAIVEPLTVGAHAIRTSGMHPGDRVVIFGPGPIGQGAAALARALGADEVAVVGLNDEARFATLRAMGFSQLFDLAEEAAADRLAHCAGDGFDVAIDCAGVPTVIDQALRLLRAEGVLAIAGMGEQPALLDVMKLVKNRLQIRGVSRIPPSIWPDVIAILANDPESFAPMVSRRMPLSKALDAFSLCRAGEVSKILLLPDD